MSDVHASSQCASSDLVQWDAIAVIEELALFDKSLEKVDADHVLTHSYWGPNYFMNEDGIKNYFISEVEKVARYALPFVYNIELWL